MKDIAQTLQQRVAQAGADAEFVHAARGLACAIHLQLGLGASGPTIVAWPADGGVGAGTGLHEAGFDPDPAPRPGPRIVLKATEAAWRHIASPAPPPGYHSFTAARRLPEGFSVDGLPLAVAQALHALERLFEILGRPDDRGAAAPPPDLSAITGSYVRLEVDGQPMNVYAESCGAADAPVMLMLHTAGADARQYHGLMADPGLQAAWRMMAFDMPGHGRSMPAPGSAWQGQALSRERYLAVCTAFARQAARQPVTLLGCSMGAAMALYMAARHPADTAGVVALEAPWRASGRLTPFLAHPAVNAAAHNPAYVRGLMGPAAALHARREAAWIYSQGGFRTYADDLHFYSEDFDASVHLRGLRAGRFGISLLTGAYDYSASPEDTRRVADMIAGARFVVMPDLGHFPMVEDPARLLAYLRPELDRIRAARAAPG